jgi:tRNA nucleotidyltransferase (CCA-adding enzyme)
LQEAKPEAALMRLHDLGVLGDIHPTLCMDDWLTEAMRVLRDARARPAWPALAELHNGWWELPYFILMNLRLTEDEQRALCKRLRVRARTTEAVTLTGAVYVRLASGEHPKRPSLWARLFEPLGDVGLAALWAAVPAARDQIAAHATRYRDTHPRTTGADLTALGLKPGPQFSVILRRLRDAWLDGEVKNETEEKALLTRLLEEEE